MGQRKKVASHSSHADHTQIYRYNGVGCVQVGRYSRINMPIYCLCLCHLHLIHTFLYIFPFQQRSIYFSIVINYSITYSTRKTVDSFIFRTHFYSYHWMRCVCCVSRTILAVVAADVFDRSQLKWNRKRRCKVWFVMKSNRMWLNNRYARTFSLLDDDDIHC